MIELKQAETFRKWRTKLNVLLCGGDKGSQARDIKIALRLADEWSG